MSEGLFDESEGRHPMWEPPPNHHALPGHIRALRKEIARQLTRFDGRRDMIVVITYCQTIYEASYIGQGMTSPSWAIGDLMIRNAQTLALLKRKAETKEQRSSNKRDAAIIQDLSDKFVGTIIKEVTA